MTNELRTHISELGRSRPYRGVPDDFTAFASLLIRSAEQEGDGLQRAISGLLKAAKVMPLDAEILISASDLQLTLAMSGQDAIVLASVLRNLRQTTPTESCFLSRNSRDFDDPDVREKLDHFGCRYFAEFDNALPYIRTRVRSLP